MAEQGLRFLGVDYGNKRIGLAVSDPTGTLVSPLACYKTTLMRMDIAAISGIAKRENACKIVVGLPLSMDGTDSAQTKKVRAFANALARESGIEVELFDERLTTFAAQELMDEIKIKKSLREAAVDQIAAQIILQEYLSTLKKES